MCQGKQHNDNQIYVYCGFGPYPARNCIYLSEKPPNNQIGSSNVWNYLIAKGNGKSHIAITATAYSTDKLNSWLLDTGSDKTLIYDFGDFYTYQEDNPSSVYVYRDYLGKRVVTRGHGEVLVKVGLEDGTIYTFLTTGFYSPEGHGKLFGM